MERAYLLLGAAAVSLAAAACSAEVVQPETRGLAESNDQVFSRLASGTAVADRNATGILTTSDGIEWRAASAVDADLGPVAVALQEPGQTQECGADGVCYRVLSPAGGIQVDESIDNATSWTRVWEISAGRIDFQDRCCGSRPFGLNDVEYVPATGVVAVSLGRYGLLTRDIGGTWHLDTLGRPDRPTSGLLVGLWVEPLVLAVLGLIVGSVTSEIYLGRLRRRLIDRDPADHAWITGRARLAPILLPALFLGAVVIVGALAFRLSVSVESDPAPSRGWLGLAVGVALVAGTTATAHRILIKQWPESEVAKDQLRFDTSRRTVFRAETAGLVATAATLVVPLIPLVLWTIGTIDAFGDAVLVAGVLLAAQTALLWSRAALRPLEGRSSHPPPDSTGDALDVDVTYHRND